MDNLNLQDSLNLEETDGLRIYVKFQSLLKLIKMRNTFWKNTKKVN